jgi:hypothetical protein
MKKTAVLGPHPVFGPGGAMPGEETRGEKKLKTIKEI